MELTKGAVRRWLASDTTADFFYRIHDEISSMDGAVHSLLLSNSTAEAAIMNARLQQLKEVTTIPDIMIKEAKGG